MRGEIVALLSIPYGTIIAYDGGTVVVGDTLDWQGVRVFVTLYATTGLRSEAIALGPDERWNARKLSLRYISYCLGGVTTSFPTTEMLLAATMGDCPSTSPVRSSATSSCAA